MQNQICHLGTRLAPGGAAKQFSRYELEMTTAKTQKPETRLRRAALMLLVALISVSYHVGARRVSAATHDAKQLQAANQQAQAQLSETEIRQRLGHFSDRQDQLEAWLQGQEEQLATAHQKVRVLKQEIAKLEPGNPQAQALQQRLQEFEAQQNQLEAWIQQQIEHLKITRQQVQFLRESMSELENHRLAAQAQVPQSDATHAQADIVEGTLLEWLKKEIGQLEKERRLTIQAWLLEQTSTAPVELDNPAKTAPEKAPSPEQTPSTELKQALTDNPEQQQPALSEQTILTSLLPAQPDHNKQSAAELERLELERELTLLDKQLAEAASTPSVSSPLPGGDAQPAVHDQPVVASLPSACIAPLQNKITRLEQSNQDSDIWFQEVFECTTCCAPLLDEIMDIHTDHVAAQPHAVVLFDFDTYSLQARYQPQIDKLLIDFNHNTDHLLLIGRASPIGNHAYNVVLSGKRAGEIKDYVMKKFGIGDAQIRFLYFGYDPPQLTLEHATAYGIKPEDLPRIHTDTKISTQDQINQSVVVIVYKNQKKQS